MNKRYLLATSLSLLAFVLIMPTIAYSTGINGNYKMATQNAASRDEFYSTDIPPVSNQVTDVTYSQVGSDSSSEASSGEMYTPESAALLSPGTITIKGTLKYYDEWGGYSPVRRIKVRLMDDDTGPDESVASQWSDSSGRFSFTVNNDDGWLQDGRDPYIKIESENPYAKCRPGTLEIYYWNLPKCGNNVGDGFYYDYGTRTLGGTTGQVVLQILNAVLIEAYWVYYRVSWTRHQLNVYYPSDGPKFHYFDSVVEHIDLPSTRHDHATVFHEYGHAILYELYGNSVPSGSGPSPHNPTSQSSGGFALREGWAEFMQCAVDNDPNNLAWGGHNIETNDWYNHVDSGDMDGNIVEGSAASILWDIFDPVSAADNDYMNWGFNQIFTVMRYDRPSSMDSFWTKWKARWSSISSSVGPLCTIYWHYGIDKDTYAPYYATVYINSASALATNSRNAHLHIECRDAGRGVAYMRFAASRTWSGSAWVYSWGSWQAYATYVSPWTLSAGDGTKYVYAQFKDYKGYVSAVYSDSIIYDTVRPTVTGVSVSPATFPYAWFALPSPHFGYVGNHTHINFTLSEPCYVTIRIYNNQTGVLVRTLPSSLLPTGMQSIEWDGRYSNGTGVPSGVYKIAIYVYDRAGNLASPYPIVTYVTVTYPIIIPK